MKRFYLSFVLLLFTSIASFAEKTYVTMTVSNFLYNNEKMYGSRVELSGDVPSSLETSYTVKNIPNISPKAKWAPEWLGYVINLLAKEGFEVEHQVVFEENSFMLLFSKTIEPSTPSKKTEDKVIE